jgi:hypothetical protein
MEGKAAVEQVKRATLVSLGRRRYYGYILAIIAIISMFRCYHQHSRDHSTFYNGMRSLNIFSALSSLPLLISAQCPEYLEYAREVHEPLSSGQYKLAYQRPSKECRTFTSPDVEDTITRMEGVIKDPDLYRLFQNAYPNTLDTAIRWKGYAADNAEEELTFIITGDINAMWLRDSSNQMQSYLPLLNASSGPNSIASLYRGVINLQARYLLTSPYCNSFQPPVESGIPPAKNDAASEDTVYPTYSNTSVSSIREWAARKIYTDFIHVGL